MCLLQLLLEAKLLRKSTLRMKSSFCIPYGNHYQLQPVNKTQCWSNKNVFPSFSKHSTKTSYMFSFYFNRYYPLFALKVPIYIQNYLPKKLQQIQIAVKCSVNSYIMYQTQRKDILFSSSITL